MDSHQFCAADLKTVSEDLAAVGEDLTALALNGKIEKIFERDSETQKVIEILGLLTAANPVLVGEAGVGKTAVAKNLARLIVENQVPDWLRGKKVVLTSFAAIWGEAGRRAGRRDAWDQYFPLVQSIIATCRTQPVVLFIDEFEAIVHHPITRTIILSALADGSLKLIAALTQRDYRRIVEQDEALNRRLQPVFLEPLSPDSTVKVLQSIKEKIETAYNIKIADEILPEIVTLSDIYIHNRFNPAKALNILERACVKAKMANSDRLELYFVNEVIAELTKVPVGSVSMEKERYKGIANFLKTRVVGQDEIVERIAQRLIVTLTRSNIEPHRPNGVFLFAGPTGVGKTELGKALSACLTGSEENLVRLDMSLYNTRDSTFALLGARPIRKDEPEIPFLTNVIRSRPYTVLLLDEFEKAHPEIWNLFLQVFDYGVLKDLEGNDIYFDNTTVVMTTNVGFATADSRAAIGFAHKDSRFAAIQIEKKRVMQALEATFPRELLGRIDEILIFNPLTPDLMKRFVEQKIALLAKKVGRELSLDEEVKGFLAERGYDPHYGARALNRTIDRHLGTQIAELKLSGNWEKIQKIYWRLNATKDGVELTW